MGAISQHGGHLDLRTLTIFTNIQSPFNTRLHIKFEETWPMCFRGEVVQRCERTDRQTADGRTDRWRVITIAHLSQSLHDTIMQMASIEIHGPVRASTVSKHKYKR